MTENEEEDVSDMLKKLLSETNKDPLFPINPDAYVAKIDQIIQNELFYQLQFPIFLNIIKGAKMKKVDIGYDLLKILFTKADQHYRENAILLINEVNFPCKNHVPEDFISIINCLKNSSNLISLTNKLKNYSNAQNHLNIVTKNEKCMTKEIQKGPSPTKEIQKEATKLCKECIQTDNSEMNGISNAEKKGKNEEGLIEDGYEIIIENKTNEQTKKQLNNKLTKTEVYSAEQSIFNIYVKEHITLGFLIEIPNPTKNNIICGLLTDYNAFKNEKFIDNYTFTISPFLKPYKKYTLRLSCIKYIFRDDFLGITFIQLPNIEKYFQVLQINYEKKKNLIIIHKDPESGTLHYISGKIIEYYGFEIQYSSNLNFQDTPYPILNINGQVVGIHKETINSSNEKEIKVAINIQDISYAIINIYNNNKQDLVLDASVRKLSKDELKSLAEHGIYSVSLNNDRTFKTRSTIKVTSLWIYRTNHSWYWTPHDPIIPGQEKLKTTNWTFIGYINTDNKPIAKGGVYDDVTPAKINIPRLQWLRENEFKFM